MEKDRSLGDIGDFPTTVYFRSPSRYQNVHSSSSELALGEQEELGNDLWVISALHWWQEVLRTKPRGKAPQVGEQGAQCVMM